MDFASFLTVPVSGFNSRTSTYTPTMAGYYKVAENGCVDTRNICVKKLIVPPKNIPCFDAYKEWPKLPYVWRSRKVGNSDFFPTLRPPNSFPVTI